jgi:tetratricopeptide (TPR) repeat protein
MKILHELHIKDLLEQARALMDEGKALHAAQLYHRVTRLSPSLDIAWIELAQVYTTLKQFDAAERALLQARDYASDRHEVTLLLGTLHLKSNRYDRALAYFKELATMEKSFSPGFQARLAYYTGLAYWYRHNHRSAEQYFRKTRRLEPRFPKIHESLGELLLRRGALAEAIQTLQSALAHDPYSWISHYLLGMAYAGMYDWKNAYEHFASAIEMDPNEPSAWHMCGEVLLSLHQLDEAEQYLRKALELNPQFTDAVVNLGYVYLKRGDPENAIEWFERALSLDPHHPKARRGKTEAGLTSHRQS